MEKLCSFLWNSSCEAVSLADWFIVSAAFVFLAYMFGSFIYGLILGSESSKEN